MVRIVSAILLVGARLVAAGTAAPSTNDLAWVNLRDIAPTIRIELRYATSRNIARSPLYPCGMQPMVRGGVARCLIAAEKTVRRYNCRLKIWDAYRPRGTQARLWKLAPNHDYVADPENGSGSLHAWGVAVDQSVLDRLGVRRLGHRPLPVHGRPVPRADDLGGRAPRAGVARGSD